jgi:hypothetical protein
LRCPRNPMLSFLVSARQPFPPNPCQSPSSETLSCPTHPHHLLVGGVNTCSRPLASLLVPLQGEPLVSVSVRC